MDLFSFLIEQRSRESFVDKKGKQNISRDLVEVFCCQHPTHGASRKTRFFRSDKQNCGQLAFSNVSHEGSSEEHGGSVSHVWMYYYCAMLSYCLQNLHVLLCSLGVWRHCRVAISWECITATSLVFPGSSWSSASCFCLVAKCCCDIYIFGMYT